MPAQANPHKNLIHFKYMLRQLQVLLCCPDGAAACQQLRQQCIILADMADVWTGLSVISVIDVCHMTWPMSTAAGSRP
jgi:hypothetical protein